MSNLTIAEYIVARSIASDALYAHQTGNLATCRALADQAATEAALARETCRPGEVRAAWVALAHTALSMSRGNTARADESRVVFFAALESAKRAARKAS
jgi:hypothetical protein